MKESGNLNGKGSDMANEIQVDVSINGLKENTTVVKNFSDSLNGLSSSTAKTTNSISLAQKGFGTLKNSLGSVYNSVFNLKTLIGTVFAGFTVGKAIEAAKVQEEAVNSLNVALQMTGKYSESASEDLQKFASELQSTTKYGDETILKTMGLIQSLGNLSESGLKEATTAAANLSSALGIDLNSAATLVGKAAAGEIGSFSRYGVVIKSGATNAETFANALDALNRKFGGAAAGQVNTFAGAYAQLSNVFGDVLEVIGDAIVKNPIVINGFKLLSKALSNLYDYISSNRENLISFVNKGIYFVVDGFNLLLSSIRVVVTTLGYFSKALLMSAQGASILLNTLLQFDALSFIFKGLINGISVFLDTILDIAETITGVGGVFNKVFKKMGVDTESFSETVSGLRVKLGDLNESLQPENLSEGMDSLNDSINGAIESTDDFVSKINTGLDSVKESTKGLGDELQKSIKVPPIEIPTTVKEPDPAEIEKINKQIDDALKAAKGALSTASSLMSFGVNVLFDSDFRKKIEPLKELFATAGSNLYKLMSNVVPFFSPVADLFKGTWATLKTTFSSIWNTAKKVLSPVTSAFDKTIGKLTENISFMGIEFGKIFNAFFDIFAKAPEEFSKMFTDLIGEIPNMIGNIMVNIANLIGGPIAMSMITAFINNIPNMVKSFAYSLVTLLTSPQYWLAVAYAAIEALIEAIPLAANSFIEGIASGFKNLFSTNLFKSFGGAIFDGFKELLEKFNPINLLSKMFHFDGGGKGAIEKFIGLDFPFVKFATGGVVGGSAKVNGDSPLNDVVPALLSPGEIVIPRSIASKGMVSVIEFIKQLGATGLKKAQVGDATSKQVVSALENLGIKPEKHWRISLGPISIGSSGMSVNFNPATWSVSSERLGVLDQAFNTFGAAFEDLTTGLQEKLLPSWLRDLLNSIRAIGGSIDIVELVKNPKRAIESVVKGLTNTFLKEPLKKVMHPPLLAANGAYIPSGTDTIPAMYTRGEFVVDRTMTQQLGEFLNNVNRPTQKMESGISDVLLSRVIDLLERPMTVESSVEINQRTLADIILSLNRSNARLT